MMYYYCIFSLYSFSYFYIFIILFCFFLLNFNFLVFVVFFFFFFFNDTPTTEIYTLSLHDALPISEIHDVDGNLRIVDGLHLVPNHLLAEGLLLHCRSLCGSARQAQSICVVDINAKHLSEIGSNRVAIAARLHDPHGCTRGQAAAHSTWNLNSFAGAIQCNPIAEIHLNYLVTLLRRYCVLFAFERGLQCVPG